MIRSTEPPRGKVVAREDWYDYVARTDLPTIAVLQDIDGRQGYGAYWGEVQSTIHKSLGAIGCVTNGSFRDLDMWAPGFQMIGGRVGPSHAHVHMVAFGTPVNIFGMQVGHDDVIHADFHGAVVISARMLVSWKVWIPQRNKFLPPVPWYICTPLRALTARWRVLTCGRPGARF